MARYMLSTYSNADAAAGPPASMDQQEMQAMMARIEALETEMRESEALVMSARLAGVDKSSVITARGGRPLATDGPFSEAKEQIAGFYMVEAASDEEAADWAGKTAECIGRPIELRKIADWR